MAYTIYVVYTVKDGMREEYMKAINESGLAERVRREEGCGAYEYYLSESDGNRLLLVESWESREHQKRHMEQPHMAELSKLKHRYVESTELGEFTLK